MGVDPISLKSVSGFHIGGAITRLHGLPDREMQTIAGNPIRHINPNGHYAVGQIYAQHFQQSTRRTNSPLHLWHGGGLTGACWEDTPDGRPGWLLHFLREGYDVVLADAPERGRASWAPYPEINTQAPWHRTIDQAWSMFRIGPEGGYHPDPALRRAFPGSQFPVEAADQMLRQFVARWGGEQTDAWARAAYEALLERTGAGIVVAHSQGGLYAFELAANRPDLFRAIVALEPVLPCELGPAVAALARLPLLIITGDHYPFPGSPRQKAFMEALYAEGGRPDVFRLPDMGIRGNTHMMMMDRNSEQIACLVDSWLVEQGLV